MSVRENHDLGSERRPSIVTAACVIVSIGLALLVIGLLAWNRDATEWFREQG